MIPAAKAKLLEGKRGLIVGIANENSIAWGCAKAFRAFGAELAVTYLNDKAKKYVEPLARELEAPIVMPLDVARRARWRRFLNASRRVGQTRFRRPLHRLFAEGSLAGARRRRIARRLSHHNGRLVLDLHPHGAPRGAADAQGRHAVHDDLLRQPDGREELQHHGRRQGGAGKRGALHRRRTGTKGIRVHAISPGPLATRAASGIPEFDALLDKAKAKAPARSLVSIDDVGVATAFLAHDAARLITGETLYIDGGYHIID